MHWCTLASFRRQKLLGQHVLFNFQDDEVPAEDAPPSVAQPMQVEDQEVAVCFPHRSLSLFCLVAMLSWVYCTPTGGTSKGVFCAPP